MVKKLLVAISLASAIGLFSAAKEIVGASLADTTHNCMEHSGQGDPAIVARHTHADGK